MARFLILCIVLVQFSIFVGALDVQVPSPAPLSERGDGPWNRRVTRHHSSDKSFTGGDLILGGFATALVAAIFSYIRITRRNQHAKTET